jgi:hypothetical protein
VSDRENFEAIRDGLLRLDPETRAEVIEGMRLFQALPLPVGVRILAAAASRAADARRPLLVMPG